MRRFHGVAKYLDHYLGWHRMIKTFGDHLNPTLVGSRGPFPGPSPRGTRREIFASPGSIKAKVTPLLIGGPVGPQRSTFSLHAEGPIDFATRRERTFLRTSFRLFLLLGIKRLSFDGLNTRKSAGFPHGMMLPCGSIPMPPITEDHSLAPRSHTRTGSAHLAIRFPRKNTPWTCTGLPRSTSRTCERGVASLSTGGTSCQRGSTTKESTVPPC